MATTTYLESKPRYEILDGLRGVAALIVVAFHLFETYSHGPHTQILNHGYLAVDFFFLLSGFVVGYAYDDRWEKMTIGGFFKRRLTRLHPMILIGTLVGAVLYYFTGAPRFMLVEQTPWWKLLLFVLLGCSLLPALPSWDIRGWREMNPLNGSSWSLVWEYVANILYALVIRRFPKFLLAIFVGLSAVLTIDLTFNIDIFGLLGSHQHYKFTVVGGWEVSPCELYIGITRLFFPFFAGLLISRIGKFIRVRGGFLWCSLLLALTLTLPYLKCGGRLWVDGAYNAFAILIVFPLIVAMGAGSKVMGQKSMKVCKFLGDISYPLYITHYPWVYMQMTWAASHKDAPVGTHICVAILIYFMVIAIAYAALKVYDEPVREWLKQHWLMRKKSAV